jgi:hypothetical protein
MKRRLPRNEQKEIEDQTRLLRSWRAWHTEQLELALAGAHGALISELLVVLDRLELNSSATLLALMQRADWDTVDTDTRFEVLHQINARISKMRERNGLAAIDDPIPPQDRSVFRIIKQRLFAPLPASAGATPEPMPAASSTSIRKSGERP